jgi:sugar lactone lactonase YvrE
VAAQVGDIVAGYRLEEKLGVGGSGCPVYRATHLRLRREVALKLLPRGQVSEAFVRRFEREAQLAASLQEHPHIVAVYDFGDTDDLLYLAMQLVRGTDLEQMIAQGPLSLTRTCVILRQIADALDLAHASGLVHRDVKPSNIFVDPAGGQDGADRAYLGDFGLTLRRDVTSSTRALWYGSPHYVAPERWAGSLPEPTVDVYALGCVAYACLSGQPPFTGDSEEKLRLEHAKATPPLLSAGLAAVPPAVDEVLATAVAKEPIDRYQTCGQFVTALRAAMVTPGAETLPGPLVSDVAPGEPLIGTMTGAPDATPVSDASPNGSSSDELPIRVIPRRRLFAFTAGALVAMLAILLVPVVTDVDVVAGAPAAVTGSAPGLSTALLDPDLSAMVIDAQGNLYMAFQEAVKKLTPQGELITVAGGNGTGFAGDGGPATKAKLDYPDGLVVDAAGDLLIADSRNGRIRRVDSNGIITTIAGTGEADTPAKTGTPGDGGPATRARLDNPTDVAVGPDGDVFVAEAVGNRIRRIDRNGKITTMAGTGTVGFAGDGGPARLAEFNVPFSLAVNGEDLYVADLNNGRVRRIDARGNITTVAGNGLDGGGGDADVAIVTELESPDNIAVGRDGTLYIADRYGDRVRRVSPDGVITTVAGTGIPGFSGDGGPGARAQIAGPGAVAVGADGVVYVGDTRNRRVRRIDAAGVITTLAGSGPFYPGDGLQATEASLLDPRMARRGRDGAVYIADASNNRIRRIGRDGVISTVAGNGVQGYRGDDGKATEAELDYPTGIAFGLDGTLYIADSDNNRVRAVRDGVIRTVAGMDRGGSAGDGGRADQAELDDPVSVEVGADGAIYIAEEAGHRIRRVGVHGIITTVAGTGEAGYSGDDGPATAARLNGPADIHVGADGALYISDRLNFRLRRVDPNNGTITTVAGNGTQGASGDGGRAVEAQLSGPYSAVTTANRTVFIADDSSHRVRRVDPNGVIRTFVGIDDRGKPVDGDHVSVAVLAIPAGLSITPDGTMIIADVGNHQVYAVGKDGILHVIAGGN